MLGYHFTGSTLRDGRPIPAVGEWLVHAGQITPCASGLHASEHPFDALRYAPGHLLHRVELLEDLQSHGSPVDKWLGRRRRIIATIDAESLLRLYSRWCALQVVHLWDCPAVVHEFLESGYESPQLVARGEACYVARAASLEAARAISREAARAASWAISREAARAAAREAARAAALEAAREAAMATSLEAARAAAWEAAIAAASAAAWEAASAAASAVSRATSWEAARAAQRQEFERLVEGAFNDKET